MKYCPCCGYDDETGVEDCLDCMIPLLNEAGVRSLRDCGCDTRPLGEYLVAQLELSIEAECSKEFIKEQVEDIKKKVREFLGRLDEKEIEDYTKRLINLNLKSNLNLESLV